MNVIGLSLIFFLVFFSMAAQRRPAGLPPAAVAASPSVADNALASRFSHQSLASRGKSRSASSPVTIISSDHCHSAALADELDYITVDPPAVSSPTALHRTDKASRILGIRHRQSMEPIPASARTSIVSTRSARDPPPSPSFVPTLPLTSLYVVSGLPKSPHTWTLADPDSVMGLHHSEGAVSRWWRPEVLGSTVSPGAGGGKKKKRGKGEEVLKGAGALSKQEVSKMLSKALKVSTLLPSPSSPTQPFPLSSLLRERSRSLPPPSSPLLQSTPLPLTSPLRTLHWLLSLQAISFVLPSLPTQTIAPPPPPFLTRIPTTPLLVLLLHILDLQVSSDTDPAPLPSLQIPQT